MTLKRYFLLLLPLTLLLLQGCSSCKVYSVRSKPVLPVRGGLMYALPRTRVCVAVTVEHRNLDNAPYAKYAQELLGLDGYDATASYAIRSIAISGENEADPRYYYFVRPGRQFIAVDDRHLLRAVGVSEMAERAEDTPVANRMGGEVPLVAQYNLYDRADTFYVRGDRPGQPSKVLAKPDSRTLRQRAVAAAERIEELQDKRQELLFGDYEGNYTPEALQYLNERLARQEQELLQLFIGSVEQQTVRYYYTPRDERKSIEYQSAPIFAFSPQRGLLDTVAAQDSASEAVLFHCHVQCDNTLRNASSFVRQHTRGSLKTDNPQQRRTFKYRQSEHAVVTVEGSGYAFSAEVRIAQFGPVVDLPRHNCQALFDRTTGDLIYYNR